MKAKTNINIADKPASRTERTVTITAKGCKGKDGRYAKIYLWAQGKGKSSRETVDSRVWSGARVEGFLFAQKVWGKRGKVIITDATNDDCWPTVYVHNLSDTSID